VEDLLLQPFIDLVGDGIGRLEEMDISLPISGSNFPVHGYFSPRGGKGREKSKPRLKTDPSKSRIPNKESMYPCIHESLY
jgi:hypothetical protein